MTNYEINKAVAKEFYGYVAFWQEHDVELKRDLDGVHCMTECGESGFFDFCSRGGQAWEVIKAYKITLDHTADNVLREAMLTYLKIINPEKYHAYK